MKNFDISDLFKTIRTIFICCTISYAIYCAKDIVIKHIKTDSYEATYMYINK